MMSIHGSSTRLFHMGHSHSHHDHHDSNNDNDDEAQQHALTPQQKQMRLRRKIALVTVVWMATCGSALIWKGRLAKSDWMAFGIASVAFSSADKTRRAIRSYIQKLARLKDGIVKHSPRIDYNLIADSSSSSSSSSTSNENNNHYNGMSSSSSSANHNNNNHNSGASNDKLRNDARDADRVTWLGAVINLVLSVGKLVIGITQHSSALVADAGHSLSDLVSDFITLWTVKVARLPADEDHPYGHWKFEAIGSLFLSLTLIATAISVGVMANKQLIEILHSSSSSGTAAKAAAVAAHGGHGHSHMIVPGKLALVMAAISIASKEWLYRITKKVGEKIRSQVVIANAWHHRSDAYSSILALLSIAWARTGVLAADAAAGLLVAGMIGMTGGEILMESVQQLSDGATPWLQKECEEHCQELWKKDSDDVDQISFVKARQVGSLSLVEVELLCPPHLSTTASRAVEERWNFWLGELYGYEATVHTRPTTTNDNDLIVRPLLEQQREMDSAAAGQVVGQQNQKQHGHDHNHDDSSTTNPASTSTSSNGTLQDFTVMKTTHNGMAMEDGNSSSSSSSSVPIMTTSAGKIETLARKQVSLFGGGSQVERVTVHYNPGYETSVDIILSSPPLSAATSSSTNTPPSPLTEESLPNLVENGATLKESLQSLIEIDNANIYWDLSSISLPGAKKKMAP
ncbi:unnamed protein product [Cylindrotheca closterium]|uniref:Cation efflux protein transmembrane domain-containing protein n=1 Tax=Cylindrotheca closterium TaxID=2856 RepID=A0AAD2G1H3_9STRA|nr:unnamed protein product [Cylindrotheca closterium]